MADEQGRPNPGVFGIDGLTHAVAAFRQHLDQLLAQHRQETQAALRCLERKVNDLPTRQEFDAAKQALGQAISDAATRITTDIQALKDAIAAGNPVTQQDLDDIMADTTALGNLDPASVPAPNP